MKSIPNYWIDFVNKYNLRGKEFEIPVDHDLSEVGAVIEILSEVGINSEMNDAYPGIIVKKDNFIPIGGCSFGCGDPYFINTLEGPKGKLYRIYHDEVSDLGYNKENAIAVVLENYELILDFEET